MKSKPSLGIVVLLVVSLSSLNLSAQDRDYLGEKGIDLQFSYIGEYFNNVSGGVATSDEGEFVSLLNLGFVADAEKVFGIKGGSFGFNFKAYQGDGVNPGYIGAYQNNSNVAAVEEQEITHAWYMQEMLDGKLWLKVGKQNGDAYFANPKLAGPFIHSSAHFAPTVPSVAYPETHWGAVLGAEIAEGFKFTVGAFRVPSGLDEDNKGQRFFGEASVNLPFSNEYPGQVRVGGWFSNVERISMEDSLLGDEHSGFYLIWDQHIAHSCDDAGCSGCQKGLGYFVQYGKAPNEYFVADQYFGAGLLWNGFLPARANDSLGFGYYMMKISEFAMPDDDYETAIELFYDIKLFERFSLIPDIQYIMNPGGFDVDAAFAVGVRVSINLY